MYNISYLQDYLGVSPLGALRLTIGSLFAPSTPEFGAAEEAAIAREKKRRKRLSGGGPATDNSSNCAELSANLCEKEQTDIVQSHIRETTHEKCKREVQTCNVEKPVRAGSERR